MIALWVMASLLTGPAPQPDCTPHQMQAVLQHTDTPLRLTCSVRLSEGQSITRPLLLEGPEASGTVVDCQGGILGREGRSVTTSRPTVGIWSRKTADSPSGGVWARPTGIIIRNCRIIGNVRIWGMGADGSYDDLRASSRLQGHIQRAQAAAPSRIQLEGLTITGRGSIPLYVGPGVTEVSLTGSTLNGTTTAAAIYLDAESAHNRITDNRILTLTGREKIAVDGSAYNRITDNRFDLQGKPGIFLYRNCGERAVIRHQTPSHNAITGNAFTGASWLRPRLVVENARNGRRTYCGADAGYPFGSSNDNRDNATGNTIRANLSQ